MKKSNTNIPESPSLTEICQLYCRHQALRPSSERMYTYVTSLFVRNTGISNPDEITIELLLEWRDRVASRATRTTFNNYRRHLKALLNFCVELGLIETNPVKKVKPFTRSNTRRKACTREELLKISNYLRADTCNPASPLILNMLLTLYYTGMRCAQLCGLVWRDIDFENNKILLREQHSKNGHEWWIPMHQSLRPKLLEMEAEQVHLGIFNDNSQVFRIQSYSHRYSGNRLTPAQLTAIFMRLSYRCGVKVSPHRIRHLFASSLANRHHEYSVNPGEPPATLVTIKEIMGHSNIITTASYIEPTFSAQRAVIGTIENLEES